MNIYKEFAPTTIVFETKEELNNFKDVLHRFIHFEQQSRHSFLGSRNTVDTPDVGIAMQILNRLK